MYRYIYGPVPSRRLGISLGVDILPRKVCNFNCVYCECGKTMKLVTERTEYYPSDKILSEIRDFLGQNPAPDFITFSGSGEPTLHSGLGFMLGSLKKEFPSIKIAVITNSSLLNLKEVRDDLLHADVVLPSLDAASEEAYIKIDRPHPLIKLSNVIEGIAEFSRVFKLSGLLKALWLEVFIVDGINTDDYNIAKLRRAILKIKPDKIQLNTLDRPGAEEWVKPADSDIMENTKIKLNLKGIEIIKKFRKREELKTYRKDIESAIVDTLRRRPSTIEDLSMVISIGEEEILKYMDILTYDKLIKAEFINSLGERGIFYKLSQV